jgi:N-acetylmuramoyl-L-alanine amidase
MNFRIKKDRLGIGTTDVEFVASPNVGGALKPTVLVIHYTATGPDSNVPKYFSNKANKVSAHLVIKRDGSVIQCVPFNVVAWHAGRSEWNMPDGTRLVGLNNHSIGIEIENWGPLSRTPTGWSSWTGAGVDSTKVIEARHKFGEPDCGWEAYTERQLEATIDAAQAITEAYGIAEIVGHDDISPGRKSDPGPAFKMSSFAARVIGRSEDEDASMVVRSETGLNIRTGAGATFPLARTDPLPNGTHVLVHEASGNWRFVTVRNASGAPDYSGWVNGAWLFPA